MFSSFQLFDSLRALRRLLLRFFFQNFERFLHVLDFRGFILRQFQRRIRFLEHFYDFRAVRQLSFELGKVHFGRSARVSLHDVSDIRHGFRQGGELSFGFVRGVLGDGGVPRVRVRGGHRVRRKRSSRGDGRLFIL